MRYIGTHIELTVNKLKVSYTDEGPDNAPVIILIHGFPLNKLMWNKQVEVLIESCRVIAYDVRGHGSSDAGTDDFSIELFVNDLIALMDALKIERAMLCGLSMGGYIALSAMENFPKRFDALILCDTSCAADSSEAKEKRLMTIENIEKYGIEHYANESLKNLFAPESFVTNRESIVWVKEMITETPLKTLSATLIALSKRKDTSSKLNKIEVPVLILVGEEDKITPPELALFMQNNIKGALLHRIEHAGHLSNIENAYDFNNHLLQFINSVNQQPEKYVKRDRLVTEVYHARKITEHEKSVKDINTKILKITSRIKDHYPELAKNIDEMPINNSDENNREITLENLTNYYESLNSVLNKYKEGSPKIGE
jgi:3-oxoadipate enol-lactonase